MKHHHIITTTAIVGFSLTLLTPMSNNAMDLQKDLLKPQHMLEADETAQLLEASNIPGITKPLTGLKSTFPGKTNLEIHNILLNTNSSALQELTEEDKTALVDWYQKIYLQLARMSPEEAVAHPLRFHKTRIYAIALKIYASKEAAKQELKAADCYSDEEQELDDFVLQSTDGYRRHHYYAGKHSVTVQKNRATDAEGLEKKLQHVQQVGGTLEEQIKQYDEQVKELLRKRNALSQVKQQNAAEQRKIVQALTTNGHSITNANTIYSESLQALQQLLLNCSEKIKQLTEEIVVLKKQTPQNEQEKETKKSALLQKSNELTQCQADQAAIQRDIHLLTNDYGLSKKLLWKLSGLLNLYPVEQTPGSPQDLQPHEEQRDTAASASTDAGAQQQHVEAKNK